MCGLYGLIFTPNQRKFPKNKVIRMFNGLAVASAARGEDATGAAIVRRSGDIFLHKDTLPSRMIVDTEKWREFLDTRLNGDTALLLGHTRFGTHGENTPANAHPFWFNDSNYGELVGAHNGVVYNHDSLLQKTTAPHASDSANVFWSLSQLAEKDFVTVMENMFGSFALVYYRRNHVYVVRNEGSPLYLSRIPELGAVAFASEARFLHVIARMLSFKCSKPKSLNPNRLYAINTMSCKERVLPFTPIDNQVSIQLELENLGDDLKKLTKARRRRKSKKETWLQRLAGSV